jgi:hypothetical protein
MGAAQELQAPAAIFTKQIKLPRVVRCSPNAGSITIALQQ